MAAYQKTPRETMQKHFAQKGWFKFRAPSPKQIFDARDAFLEVLQKMVSTSFTRIEDYHLHIPEGSTQHIEIQAALSETFAKARFAQQIAEAQLDVLIDLIGLDLHVQRYPYVRIARPSIASDNIGMHRDTEYGSSPFELSVWIPYTNIDAGGALKVLPRSHILAKDTYQYDQEQSAKVKRGSTMHQLGYPYAPKTLRDDVEKDMIPVPMRLGEILVFCLSLVHGQSINKSSTTRISTDIRIVNSLAPIAWERSVHKDYYERLSISAVTKQAHAYLASSGELTPALHHLG